MGQALDISLGRKWLVADNSGGGDKGIVIISCTSWGVCPQAGRDYPAYARSHSPSVNSDTFPSSAGLWSKQCLVCPPHYDK